MEIALATPSGKKAQGVEVSATTFGRDYNEALIHQVVTAHLAGARAGTRAHKSRSDVSGGGAKPWRQKGTGRARAGTIRSPIWRTGGKTFAARPQDHSQKVNKKMYKRAMQSILSELHRQGRLILVEDLSVEEPKTKALLAQLKALNLTECLMVTAEWESNLYLAARNLSKVDLRAANDIDPVSLLKFEKVLMTVGAVRKLEEVLA